MTLFGVLNDQFEFLICISRFSGTFSLNKPLKINFAMVKLFSLVPAAILISSSWKYSSSVIPSNFYSETLSKVTLLHFTFIFSFLSLVIFVGVDTTITFVFALLKTRFVSLDHVEIEWISFSILLINSCRWLVLHARYYVASSAYCKHSLSGVICDISATHRFKNIAPHIEPYGTLNSDVKRVEKCASIWQYCRKVK